MPVANFTTRTNFETSNYLPLRHKCPVSARVKSSKRGGPIGCSQGTGAVQAPSYLGGSQGKRSDRWNQPPESESSTTG